MPKSSRDAYDAIIIGAGIGGLVCGCYLAKAGMKVLICEQHSKPGGYCTSFRRQGFTFDAAAHSFGGLKNGNMGKILDELEITKKIRIRRFNPCDTVTTPDYKISFWSDEERTMEELQRVFPEESKNIKALFSFLTQPDPLSFVRLRGHTFQDLLKRHLSNEKLKAILSFPLFGNSGLPPSRMSAFMGAKIFKEFLLDGGYYPEGGMQAFANALAGRFQELGGELRLSRLVEKIRTRNAAVSGVVIKFDGFTPSRLVVSNCDAQETFLKLLGTQITGRDFLKKISIMKPSLSAFIVYLGIDSAMELPDKSNLWFLSDYDLDQAYLSARKGVFHGTGGCLVHPSPEQRTVQGYLIAPFKSRAFWDRNKRTLSEALLKTIESHAIPGLSRHILYKEMATPLTLFKYTLNALGAAYGWESTPSQLGDPDFRRPHFLSGLHLTGHWTTAGLGIPGVTYIGYATAQVIVKKATNSQRRLSGSLLKKSLQNGPVYTNFRE